MAAPSAARTALGGPFRRVRRALGGQERGRRRSAERCEVELAYAIGVSHPAQSWSIPSVPRWSMRTGSSRPSRAFDLRPGAIIRDLDLRRPHLRKTAAYGHFGREDADFTWEKHRIRVEELKAAPAGWQPAAKRCSQIENASNRGVPAPTRCLFY